MAKWTTGKPQIATETDVNTKWCGGKPGEYFYCGWCGYKFKVGDYFKWIFTNHIQGAGGNPKVCKDCDCGTVKLIERRKTILSVNNNPTRKELAVIKKFMVD